MVMSETSRSEVLLESSASSRAGCQVSRGCFGKACRASGTVDETKALTLLHSSWLKGVFPKWQFMGNGVLGDLLCG